MDDIEALSPFQEQLIRSVLGREAGIISIRYMQDLRPSPLRIDAHYKGGICSLVLRISRNAGGVEREALVLPFLKGIGLPVPEILSPPTLDPSHPELNSMMITEFLQGETLQIWASKDAASLEFASRLLSDTIHRLHSITDDGALGAIPRRSLQEDLRNVTTSRWMDFLEIQQIVARVQAVVDRLNASLVFSNGDYQPGNFLSDGRSLTGILDFEKAAFVDPLSVLARYPVYDLRPLSRSGFIEATLSHQGFTLRDFAPRVAVFCLRTLQTKVPVSGGTAKQATFRDHVLSVMREAVELPS